MPIILPKQQQSESETEISLKKVMELREAYEDNEEKKVNKTQEEISESHESSSMEYSNNKSFDQKT